MSSRSQRIHGFDIIRLIAFFIVAFYHLTYAVFHEHEDMFYAYAVSDPVYNYSFYRLKLALASSGHILLFLSMILVAIAQKKLNQILRFSLFLLAAWLLFIWADNGFGTPVPAWDIHPLLFVGLLTVAFAEKINWRLVPILGVAGFAMTLVRWYDLPVFADMNVYAKSVLVGDCEHNVSSWPVLPWLGFLYFGYAIGFGLRNSATREKAKTMSRREAAAWGAALFAALFHVGAYYRIPMEQWECKAFHLDAVEFYSDFIFVLFLIRISLIESVDRFLSRTVPWISKLNVSRNFFLAYALQYAFAFLIGYFFADRLRTHSQWYMWAGILMLPAGELVAFFAAKLGLRRLFKG